MLNKLFRWQKGRQLTGYDKMLLGGCVWPIKLDTYLLRFPEGSEVPVHTDKVEQGRHYRLNIVLKNAKEGGDFICEQPIYENSRVKLFRPDISKHSVSRIVKGNRYLLSIGFVLN